MGCLPPINWCRISQPSTVGVFRDVRDHSGSMGIMIPESLKGCSYSQDR